MNSSAGHRLGNAPRINAANLIRGLALCAAVAATLFGPTVLAGRVALEPDVVRFIVTLFTIGAALLALRGRLAAPRSLRAWLGWALGSVVLLLIGIVSLGGAMIYLLAEQGARIAIAATIAWACAVGLNALEAGRAFGVARRLCAARHALYRLSAALLVVLSALRIADLALPAAQRSLAATAFESLAPGLATLAGLLFAAVIGAAAWRVPQALAQRQFDGRLAASAAGESMWFCGLATLLMPLALPEVRLSDPAAPLAAAAWGEVALHVLSVVVAHGVVRIGLGGAGSVPPVPLLVLHRGAAAGTAAQRLLERLPRAWGAGPVCRVMPPTAAAAEHGTHLQLAALTGREALLFPVAAQDLPPWRDALPPWQHWRALATQELYAGPALWREALGAWLNPQTWVLLVEDGASRPSPGHGHDWADALPDSRCVRLNLGAADDSYWPAALRHLPAWTDDTGRADARAFALWLRGRVRPEAPRRILLLHARAEAALASALAAQLDGRADVHGRFVEAWTVAEHGHLDWRMPLDGFRLMAQVHVNQLQQQLRSGVPGALERLRLRGTSALTCLLLGLRAQEAPAPYDLVLLHTQALRDAAGRWGVAPEAQPLLASSARRLALRLDGGDATLCEIDAQIAAPLADPAALDATALRRQATKLAEQILADAWVALAPAHAEPPAVPTPPEAVLTERLEGLTDALAESVPPVVRTRPRLMLVHAAGSELWPDTLHRALEQLIERFEDRIEIVAATLRDKPLWSPEQLAVHDAVVLLSSPSLVGEPGLDRRIAMLQEHGKPVWRITLLDARLPPFVAGLPCLSARDDVGAELALLDAADLDDQSGTLRLRADAAAVRLRGALKGIVPANAEPAVPMPDATAAAPPPEADVPILASLPAPLMALAAGPGGMLLAGLANGMIVLQGPGSERREARPFDAHRSAVTALLALTQGRLVSASQDGEVLLWAQLPPAAPPRVLGRHEGAVHALAVSHDGDWVLSGGDDRMLRGWCLAGEVAPRASAGFGGSIRAIDSDADRLYAACGDGGAAMLMAGSDAPIPIETAPGSWTQSVQVMGDTMYLAGHDSAARGFVRRLKLRQDGLGPRELTGWPSPFTAMLVLADERVVLGCQDGSLWLWSPSVGANQARQLGSHATGVRVITYDAGVERIATLDESGRVVELRFPGPA